MNSIVKIKDVYEGKPDAKDEVRFNTEESFLKSFIVPSNFNVSDLIEGTKCFITGFKGVGKTALEVYCDNIIRESDDSTYSSFMFFKEDFPDNKRQELDALSRRLITTVDVNNQNFLMNKTMNIYGDGYY